MNSTSTPSPLVVRAPMDERKVLLHTCCAPCSSAIVECLMRSGITPTIFYSNPNIFPAEEYVIRRDECSRYAAALGLEVVDADYDHDAWLSEMHGLENEPERSSRCLRCFSLRLYRTALYAAGHGFKVITTTLASSRWKSLEQINAAGQWAVDKVNAEVPGAGLVWWEQNWRKGGLQQRRQEIIKEYGFYNQLYCGCEFSKR